MLILAIVVVGLYIGYSIQNAPVLLWQNPTPPGDVYIVKLQDLAAHTITSDEILFSVYRQGGELRVLVGKRG